MPRHRFNSKQKRYLGENLHYGETTRIKVNPDGVSKEMRFRKDHSGKRRKRILMVGESLRPQEITPHSTLDGI